MTVQVKICGITTPDAADAAVRFGADFVGLVFVPNSPRRVKPEQASALASRLRGRCRIVALIADASDAEIELAIQASRPDFLQLHGSEMPDRVAAVGHRFALPLIKAIPVAEAGDLAAVPHHERVADMLLFDAKAPPNAHRPGGLGAAFDWQLLRGRSFRKPWLLAGGLTVENVARAIRACDAPGVDVSSGVEIAPGVKSADLIGDFIHAARHAQFAKMES